MGTIILVLLESINVGRCASYPISLNLFPSDFRSFAHGDTGDFRNRIATRVVMQCHDRSIVHFKSGKQLLGALRDAIAGE